MLCYVAGPLQRCGIWGCHVGHGQGPLAKLLVTLPAFRPAAAPQDGKVPIKLQTFSTFVTCCHVVTLCHPLKIREGPRKSSWLGIKAGDFHRFFIHFITLSWLQNLQKGPGWSKTKLCQAAPNPLMSMMAGWELELLTVLLHLLYTSYYLLYSLKRFTVYMSWGSGAFVPHSKSPHVSSKSQFPLIQDHPSLSCRFAWRPLKPYEIATCFESLQGDFGTQGASGSVPQPGMGWRCAELFFLACWKLSPAVSLAVTCQTSIREPTWLDPLSNLHRHSTLQGRMCEVASRAVLVFWALLV